MFRYPNFCVLKIVFCVGKYALMLHAMSKQCSTDEVRSLKEAEELVKFQLRHGNDLLTMDSIQFCDVNLKEQGNLLRQVSIQVNCKQILLSSLYVFCKYFEDDFE